MVSSRLIAATVVLLVVEMCGLYEYSITVPQISRNTDIKAGLIGSGRRLQVLDSQTHPFDIGIGFTPSIEYSTEIFNNKIYHTNLLY
ncbi:hypothetical protein AX774_g6748 [Zancudomyces culisetae]|uniref:Uncharacterized protein n=1 Tax=Zancudomyces culisetae TaxID=1213189 RepID=A0A1R1PFY7_ZANCU|nr:hypothetical protein AX774_g6748 [Zancudomyces culisetae]|eukprot:OMH79828.1 hypothetical protein AX774_g6748 [Zancudomyces culisetae]